LIHHLDAINANPVLKRNNGTFFLNGATTEHLPCCQGLGWRSQFAEETKQKKVGKRKDRKKISVTEGPSRLICSNKQNTDGHQSVLARKCLQDLSKHQRHVMLGGKVVP
jgi:hypothetical protein